MQLGLGFSNSISAATAAREAVGAARDRLGGTPADELLVFATAAIGQGVGDVLDAVRTEAGNLPIHGGSVSGVFAAGEAAEQNPGLVVAMLAGPELEAVLLEDLEVDDPHAAEEVTDHLGKAAGEGDLLFVASDFAHHAATSFFASLASGGGPGARAIGLATAAAGADGLALWSADQCASRGVLALALRGPSTVDLVPRCRPIDRTREVTRARDNWVSGIGEAAAVDVLRAAARGANLAETPDSLRRLVVEVAHPGASALRPIAGVDFERGAILIPGAVAAGDRIRVAVLDAVASRENLERLVDPDAGAFGLYLSGTGSDSAANGEFSGEARWFGGREVLGLASPQIFGPTGLGAGAAQPLPACSLLARVGV